MYSSDTLEYGVFPLSFAVPEGFGHAYTLCCGYGATEAPSVIGGGDGGLLCCILRGGGTAELGGAAHSFAQDDVLIAENGESSIITPRFRTEYLYLRVWHMKPLLEGLGLASGVCSPDPQSRIDQRFGQICMRAKDNLPDNVYDAASELFALAAQLGKWRGEKKSLYPALIREAIEVIREDYAFLSGISELAETLSVTESHLIRAFSASVGMTPGKFLQLVRIDNAMPMLQSREYSIETVANMLGFSSGNYFSKVFRSVTGESPAEYRSRSAVGDSAVDRRLRGIEAAHLV